MKRDSFVEFVQEQLEGLNGIVFRPMFGGWGIYKQGIFFGILYKGRLYFKTNELTRAAYKAQGMEPFRPFPKRSADKTRKPMVLKNYFEVPAEVLEDKDQLHEWARRATTNSSL